MRVDANAAPETATTPVIGYRAKNAVTATKTDTPLAETPQSVTVVTRDQIVDQGATNLQDALNYAAGVRSDAYGLDSRTDSVRVRGSDPERLPRRPAPGLRLLHQHHPHRALHAGAPRSAARPGRHAVRRGHGRGVVNMVSKRPLPRPSAKWACSSAASAASRSRPT
jgi:iron complex outermembrane receptor protein